MSNSHIDHVEIVARYGRGDMDLARLLNLLEDPSGTVRVNALFALPQLDLPANERIASAIIEAATGEHSEFHFMGMTTQKHFAIATLSFLKGDLFKPAFIELRSACTEAEQDEIDRISSSGPVF